MMKKLILLMFSFLFSVGLIAQTIVSGTVIDADNKEPLSGATIKVKGKPGVGTTADVDGRFSFKSKESVTTLIVSYIGFRSAEVAAGTDLNVTLEAQVLSAEEVVVSASRVEEALVKAAVTVEKISARQLALSPAINPYDALGTLKGVDLLTQSLSFKSVNLRGFGANNNNRFVQLTDGMDNRSPGLGFGFGNAAGISDLDIQSIEILPGASSALYGPDALQGLMLTKSKNPFQTQGLSAQVRVGANNVGAVDFENPTPYTDIALRYAKVFNKKLALKVNLQRLDGTDFVANDYNDRSTRGRAGFFKVDQTTKTVGINYVRNNDSNTNLQYDGVNIYGDDVTNGGAFSFPATSPYTLLQGKTVTRTGYKELDLAGNGKIFNNRASASLHYKLTDKIEAMVGWYYGGGNFFRTGGFREYFPDYKRNQFKVEVSSEDFFVRAYRTQQEAEGYNVGQLGARLLALQKTTTKWGDDFGKVYTGNNLDAARAAADAGKYLPGSAIFDLYRDSLANTYNNAKLASGKASGVRFRDNSSMTHAEAMYNFTRFMPENVELVAGTSYRYYEMNTGGTIFPATADGSEFTIGELGAYTQLSYNVKLGEELSVKPTAGIRYDKNEYFDGGFTPRLSMAINAGEHNVRASWQSAFRNPSANQLLADGKIGEVGGSRAALEAANLFANKGYTEASVLKYRSATGTTADLVAYEPVPENFSTEKVKTWELGYKTLIGNRLFVDAFYYNSTYNDFIATQNYVQPISGKIEDLKTGATSKTYQVNFNNFNEIFVSGGGIGLEFALGKGYTVSGNYANQVGKITLKDNLGATRKDAFGAEIVKRKMSDPVVSQVGRNFFISPEHRFNIGFGNSKLTKNLGFNINYRWTDEMWVEQGNTAGDVWLPSWTSLDAQVTVRVPKIKSSVKIGATNIMNKYYSQGYGLAQIGGMYYVAITYDQLSF